MKTATAALRNLLDTATDVAFSDLVTITLTDATVARWTTDTYDLTWDGNTYTAGGSGTAPGITRGRIREATGLEVATMELSLDCGPASGASIGGTDIRVLAVDGALDDARVTVQRAYMATPSGAVVGVVSRFSGVATDCEATSHRVTLRVQSDLYRLEERLPRHLIREKCSWALGDDGCGVNLASYTHTGAVATVGTPPPASTRTTIYVTGAMATKASGYFDGGTLTFTSGALSGISRTVKYYTQTVPMTYFELVAELPEAPSPGDTVSAKAGCDKTIATCTSRFSNIDRRRGFDFVPPPDYVTR